MSCVTGRKEARLDRPSMTGGGAALKARGYPPIFFENRLPPRPLRDAALRSAALTSAPLSVPQTPFSMVRTRSLEITMDMSQSIGTASNRVMDETVAGLAIDRKSGVT